MTFTVRLTLFMVLCSALFAANNPVPFVNQPLVPASVAPGGNSFQLTVNGTGFVAGSTINWNGSPRATTFVNQGQLTATILSTDIATASTASITVSSPAPGGGASAVVFLPVRNPSSFVSLNTSTYTFSEFPSGIVTGDFNRDGNQDIATTEVGPTYLTIDLGNGDGTFRQGAMYTLSGQPQSVVTGDFNNDGKLDIAIGEGSNLEVFLGNGNGSFEQSLHDVGESGYNVVVGDFNRDGSLDLIYSGGNEYCILFGNGDGTFQSANCTAIQNGSVGSLAAGDFNGDGRLDFSGVDESTAGGAFIFLGNGDGTFQQLQSYPTGGYAYSIVLADLNGDGKLDLVVENNLSNGILGSIAVLLGNGDGTFQPYSSYQTAYAPTSVAVADMNGDGKLDLVAADYGYGVGSLSLLLGNGDGTFQSYEVYGANQPVLAIPVDFNNDGRLDVGLNDVDPQGIIAMLQDNGTVIGLSQESLKFPTQAVGTVSQPKLITVINNGTSTVKVSGISTTANFSQLSNCKTIQPGGSCKVGVYFTPTIQGALAGYLALADNGGGSPQLVTLSGTATIVELDPTSLSFGDWKVGSTSKSQNVIVTNNGNGPLQISKIAIGGADPRDFYQVNACPAKLAAGSSCTITVLFHPTATGVRSALLGVADNGGGSPQTVALSGTGT